MPEFRKHPTGPVISRVKMHVKHTETIFFQSDWQDISLVGTNPSVAATFHLQPQHKGAPGHLWRLTLVGQSSGNASLVVQPGPRSSAVATRPAQGQPPVAAPKPVSLDVDVANELILPPVGSDAGLIARILLHETPTPGFHTYNSSDAKTVMNYMRNILENRRFRRYDLFGFKNQPTLIQLVHQRGQFGGLGNYPNVPGNEMVNVNACLSLANNDDDPRQSLYAQHVQSALDVANQPPPPDPTKAGLYFWRTAGHADPGGFAAKFTTLLGLTFYTLDDTVPKPIHGARD